MFLTKNTIISLMTIIAVFCLYKVSSLFVIIGILMLVIFVLAFLWDMTSVFQKTAGFECSRECPNWLSNGDENTIKLTIQNLYDKAVSIEIIDEIPPEFQKRDFLIKADLKKGETKDFTYTLTPQRRGEYEFHDVHIYVFSRFKLLQRRFKFDLKGSSKVYPSFAIIRNTQLLSAENKSRELGVKNVRRVGQSSEFENIKEYVKGDDYRTINWKASARKHQLMCNVYGDEQSQQIYNIIDKGKGMQQAFNGMTLLDYSINAAVALSYVAISHNDKAGLITFEKNVSTHLPADKKSRQINLILEALYNEKTDFKYSDFTTLHEYSKKKITKRSLFIIYTTFDNMASLERQMPFLKLISQRHTLLIVFFKDSELEKMCEKKTVKVNDYFKQTIAEKFMFEQKLIIKRLQQNGIYALLTRPEDLNVNTINKYIELKAKRII